jgi:outer membrane protein TolC
VEASVPIVNVSSWKNVKGAGFGEEASRYQYQFQEQTVFEQAVAAYYFALLSHEATLLNRELVNANDSLFQVAEVRFNNGVIETLELNRIKSIFLESQTQLRESEGLYLKNISALKALMGIGQKDSLLLTEQIAQTITRQNEPATLNISYYQTARFKYSSLKFLQSEEDRKRQRARVLPELSLIARYSRQSFSNDMDLFSGSQPWFDVGVVGLRAEWNLFTGFNRQASIRQATLQSRIAKQESDNSAIQVQKEFDELQVNHQVAAYGLNRYTEHFQLNRTNHQVALEKYDQGVYTLDQFITVYQETVRSQNQYLAKLANFLVYDSIISIKNKYQVK